MNKWNFKLVDRGTGKFTRSRMESVVIKNQDYILHTVGNIVRLYVHRYEPKFKGLAKITELFCPEGKPYCEESFAFFSEVMDAGFPLKVICVVWGYFICYYPMLMGKEGLHIPLGGTISTDVKIFFASPLENGLFALIDDKMNILHYNLQNHSQLEAQSVVKAMHEQVDSQKAGSESRETRSESIENFAESNTASTLLEGDTSTPEALGDSNDGVVTPLTNQEDSYEDQQRTEVESGQDQQIRETASQILFENPNQPWPTIFLNNEPNNLVLFNTRFKLESKDLYLTKDNKLINSLISARNSQFFVLRNSSLLCYELFSWADYVKSMI